MEEVEGPLLYVFILIFFYYIREAPAPQLTMARDLLYKWN